MLVGAAGSPPPNCHWARIELIAGSRGMIPCTFHHRLWRTIAAENTTTKNNHRREPPLLRTTIAENHHCCKLFLELNGPRADTAVAASGMILAQVLSSAILSDVIFLALTNYILY